ncbi:MAG: hypothetical protein JWL62_2222 [Hyphomicrobiales bacterium]|nr:hypothetical protein [Hyphomicrobiales bacterium]
MRGKGFADCWPVTVDEIEYTFWYSGVVQDLCRQNCAEWRNFAGTTVQPAAKAGANFDVTWFRGFATDEIFT